MEARVDVLRGVSICAVLGVIPFDKIANELSIDPGPRHVKEGDVVLAKVSSANGYRSVVFQELEGRSLHLCPGDSVVGVLGLRQSTTHLVGRIPSQPLNVGDRLHLLSEGGIVGELTYSPARLEEPPILEITGILMLNGGVLNMADFAPPPDDPCPLPPILLVAGTSSEIGKTTLSRNIIRFLVRKYRLDVTSIIMSGTGGKADAMAHREAGAKYFHSFIETGFSNSYGCDPRVFLPALESLFYRVAAREDPDVIIGEMGGDLIWGNNDAILSESVLTRSVRLLIVVASDAVSALGAKDLLSRWGVRIPLAFASYWLRSYGGMALRFRKHLKEECIDATDKNAIERFVDRELAGRITQKPTPAPFADLAGSFSGV